MTELNQEWRELRRQIGNFFCKLENEGNHAVENAEIRQKIYDKGKIEGYAIGYDKGCRDIWDCLATFFDMSGPAKTDKFGLTSLKDILATMSRGEFQLTIEEYRNQKKKAEEEKSALPVVGDVIKAKSGSYLAGETGVVIEITKDKIKFVAKNFSRCEIGIDTYKNYFEKTGEHYDMANSYFLKEDK